MNDNNSKTAVFQQRPLTRAVKATLGVVVLATPLLTFPGSTQAVVAITTPATSEQVVNSETSSQQWNPWVAMDNDGDFVVVWQSYGQDGPDYGVYGQRYNAAAVPQGPEFQVNTYTTGHQDDPSVAMDADGDFVVVWESGGKGAQDGEDDGIYGQRYNAAGTRQGSEFRVNTYTTQDQSDVQVAMDAAGNFVVVWESYNQDGDDEDVYARRYNAAGIAQGSEFLVNTYMLICSKY
ncbi:MAG: hypothetical protein HOC23_12725 [Halieaceae bacterium]|jgi:hypothetical protein|nr:hypothetical protein [Halieaceae bacterium]